VAARSTRGVVAVAVDALAVVAEGLAAGRRDVPARRYLRPRKRRACRLLTVCPPVRAREFGRRPTAGVGIETISRVEVLVARRWRGRRKADSPARGGQPPLAEGLARLTMTPSADTTARCPP
jgi:hypothetical protein